METKTSSVSSRSRGGGNISAELFQILTAFTEKKLRTPHYDQDELRSKVWKLNRNIKINRESDKNLQEVNNTGKNQTKKRKYSRCKKK